jgi:transcription initiation factor IIE alpha subunit
VSLSFKKKYFNKLRYKSKYIHLEYEESLEIYKKAKFEFLKSVSEYADKNKKNNPFLIDCPKARRG